MNSIKQERNNLGQFTKGMTPWNKNTKGVMKPNRGSFQIGSLPKNTTKPRGTVARRVKKSNGEISYVINIDWRGNRKPNNNYRWYLWEVANQQDRPKGFVIWLIDRDPDNISLDNFEVVTKGEVARRNRHGIFNHGG